MFYLKQQSSLLNLYPPFSHSLNLPFTLSIAISHATHTCSLSFTNIIYHKHYLSYISLSISLTHMHTHTCTHTHAHTHMHTHTYTHILNLSHSQAHTHKHTHSISFTLFLFSQLSITHTHTLSLSLSLSFCHKFTFLINLLTVFLVSPMCRDVLRPTFFADEEIVVHAAAEVPS